MQSSMDLLFEATHRMTEALGLTHELSRARITNNEAEFVRLTRALAGTVPKGIYEHYKSTEEHPMIYAVSGVSIDPWESEIWVPYTFLYGPFSGISYPRTLLHPGEGFLVPVSNVTIESGLYSGARFTLLYEYPLAATRLDLRYLASDPEWMGREANRTDLLAQLGKLLGHDFSGK